MPQIFNFSSLPPLSLYIHMPWCTRKCPYCDFNSHEKKIGTEESGYIKALIDDLENDLPTIWGRSIDSIFIGGGTPSLFSGNTMKQLFSELRARLNIRPMIEVTIEANPGSIEPEKLEGYLEAGINRLSIGVQSFNPIHLNALGRIHDSEEARSALHQATNAGFENINLDLMYGLPQQTVEEATSDVDIALELSPSHLSHYQLTIEPNTYFHHQPPPLPTDDSAWEMQQQCQQRLAASNYHQYEVSAYAQGGKQCQHNLNYWQFGDYLGIGAGAHSKISNAQNSTITRTWKEKNPEQYISKLNQGLKVSNPKLLTQKEVSEEFMMNGLRLRDGFSSQLFQQHTGLPLNSVKDALTKAEQQSLITWDMHHVKPTQRGMNFLNNLLGIFFEDDKQNA